MPGDRSAERSISDGLLYWIAGACGFATGIVGAAFHLAVDSCLDWPHWLTARLGFGWPAIGAAAGVAALGVLLAFLLTHYLAPEAAGSGVPEVEGALEGLREVRWRRVLPVMAVWALLAIIRPGLLARGFRDLRSDGDERLATSAEPIVGDVWVELVYPAYTGLPSRSIAGLSGQLLAMPGTTVKLEARALVPLWHPVYRDSYSIEALRAGTERSTRMPGLWDALRAIGRLAVWRKGHPAAHMLAHGLDRAFDAHGLALATGEGAGAQPLRGFLDGAHVGVAVHRVVVVDGQASSARGQGTRARLPSGSRNMGWSRRSPSPSVSPSAEPLEQVRPKFAGWSGSPAMLAPP